MHAPLTSTITLIAELFISAIIYYTFYLGYKHNKFPIKLAAFALLYEIIFNISYMASRVGAQTESKFLPPAVILFAAVHGILSLLMFILLVIYFILAWKNYKKDTNYFKTHKVITILFFIFWTFSIASGIIFYFLDYYLL